ncbi:putative hydrolase of the HAD superfamily [Hoeflea marina]|uniref:Putative hydrolase of the HAD superfamily n=1 Tax=Hoeflea marina TaxID=274592 RepID=A0A317PLY5_9HYPH|nr:pyrimidine 5'-nucleotidase [Hoeflea marina]PWW00057.1 putative hydrolase of the HAD superfamily [Hoeflea marina]
MTQKTTAPDAAAFADVTEWVFDLDNTLYPRHTDLFSQIDRKMTQFIRDLLDLGHDEARALQKSYYRDHGTTLQGLMIHHKIDPNVFLEQVHDIDYSWVKPDEALGEAIRALPGRKFIFTNGDTTHARRAATALGILDHFDDIFDIIAADLTPKPAAATYDRFLARHGVDARRAAMFEDLPRNLKVPHDLGMRTVLIVPRNLDTVLDEVWEHEGRDGDHVQHITDDLSGFLQAVLPGA